MIEHRMGVSRPRAEGGVSARQWRFVEEYIVDMDATQAAIRAGYSERSAHHQGARLLANIDIQAAIAAAAAKRPVRVTPDRGWVLVRLKEVVERALQYEPVLDRRGNPTGAFTYNAPVALRALELIGKQLHRLSEQGEVQTLNEEETLDWVVKGLFAEMHQPQERREGRGTGTTRRSAQYRLTPVTLPTFRPRED